MEKVSLSKKSLMNAVEVGVQWKTWLFYALGGFVLMGIAYGVNALGASDLNSSWSKGLFGLFSPAYLQAVAAVFLFFLALHVMVGKTTGSVPGYVVEIRNAAVAYFAFFIGGCLVAFFDDRKVALEAAANVALLIFGGSALIFVLYWQSVGRQLNSAYPLSIRILGGLGLIALGMTCVYFI